MNNNDVRWIQRLENLEKAFQEFQEAVDLAKSRQLTKLEKQGLIQAFEYTHELSWNVLKDFFIDQGNNTIAGSKDATREAFKVGIIKDGQIWMDMIKSRNLTSHSYNQETAETIVSNIMTKYYSQFKDLISELNSRK
ncbi:MAG: nucleotidyltransferase substrate binding protein [Halobacteriovoraceae bacterium]|nr:nucleotidyltransferase substrate binding protein [Halobacteriovoraceae bacterium]